MPRLSFTLGLFMFGCAVTQPATEATRKLGNGGANPERVIAKLIIFADTRPTYEPLVRAAAQLARRGFAPVLVSPGALLHVNVGPRPGAHSAEQREAQHIERLQALEATAASTWAAYWQRRRESLKRDERDSFSYRFALTDNAIETRRVDPITRLVSQEPEVSIPERIRELDQGQVFGPIEDREVLSAWLAPPAGTWRNRTSTLWVMPLESTAILEGALPARTWSVIDAALRWREPLCVVAHGAFAGRDAQRPKRQTLASTMQSILTSRTRQITGQRRVWRCVEVSTTAESAWGAPEAEHQLTVLRKRGTGDVRVDLRFGLYEAFAPIDAVRRDGSLDAQSPDTPLRPSSALLCQPKSRESLVPPTAPRQGVLEPA